MQVRIINRKDTGEVLQDGDVPDVVIERVHGIVTVGTNEDVRGERNSAFGLNGWVCNVVPVLFLKSFKCRHVVHLSQKLTENSHLKRIRGNRVKHGKSGA